MTGRSTAEHRRGTRALRVVGALLTLAILLIGVPWLLIAIGNPHELIRLNWGSALLVHADSRVWLALLSVIGWMAWLFLALTVVFEALGILTRRRISLALPGSGWLRPLVVAAVAAVATAPHTALADHSDTSSPTEAAAPGEHPKPTPQQNSEATTQTYVVANGDELWSIAERELGAGQRWHEIAARNGLPDARITPGDTLRLPVTSPVNTVAVNPGDTLWAIAEEQLADPLRWPELAALNAQLVADPDVLPIGIQLRLPSDAAQAGDPNFSAQHESNTEITKCCEPQPEIAEESIDQTESLPSVSVERVKAGSEILADHPETSLPSSSQPTDLSDTSPTSSTEANLSLAVWATSLGAALAASVVTTLIARRRAQLHARSIGRRLPALSLKSAALLTGLTQTATTTSPPDKGILLGWTEDEDPIKLDLETARLTVFIGEGATAALGAVVTNLVCDPWGPLVVLPGGQQWATALDEPRVTSTPDTVSGLAELTRLCTERRLELRERTLESLRNDPDLAEHWQPTVFVFQRPLTAAQAEQAAEAIRLGAVGVSVVFAAPSAPPEATVVGLAEGRAELHGRRFIAQSLPELARHALIELFTDTGRADTEPAPWWATENRPHHGLRPKPNPDSPREPTMTVPWPSDTPSPRLLLLGDADLVSAAGTAPTRARQQCLEYCAWLLEHPGATPTMMLQELLVAETTRRSNMSRLRTWLGRASDGSQYLPDAYSGRIWLDPRVKSDWTHFQERLANGVNKCPSSALVEALSLVRGAPLGPNWFQWTWAERMRADIIAMIVDSACELADRAIASADLKRALWALQQAKKTGEEFDSVTVREIHVFAIARRRPEMEAAVIRLTRATRGANRDLAPALAQRVRHALHLAQQPSAPASICHSEVS